MNLFRLRAFDAASRIRAVMARSHPLADRAAIDMRDFDGACGTRGIVPTILMELDGRIAAMPIAGPGLTDRHAIACLARRRNLRLTRAVFEPATRTGTEAGAP